MTDDNETRPLNTDQLRDLEVARILVGAPKMVRVRDDDAPPLVPLTLGVGACESQEHASARIGESPWPGEASNRRLLQPDFSHLARQEAETAAYLAAQEVENLRNIRMAALQLAATRSDHDDPMSTQAMIDSAAKIEAFIINGAQAGAATVQ